MPSSSGIDPNRGVDQTTQSTRSQTPLKQEGKLKAWSITDIPILGSILKFLGLDTFFTSKATLPDPKLSKPLNPDKFRQVDDNPKGSVRIVSDSHGLTTTREREPYQVQTPRVQTKEELEAAEAEAAAQRALLKPYEDLRTLLSNANVSFYINENQVVMAKLGKNESEINMDDLVRKTGGLQYLERNYRNESKFVDLWGIIDSKTSQLREILTDPNVKFSVENQIVLAEVSPGTKVNVDQLIEKGGGREQFEKHYSKTPRFNDVAARIALRDLTRNRNAGQ